MLFSLSWTLAKFRGASFNTNAAAAAAACLFACHPALRISLIISSWGGTTAKFAGPSLPTRVCNTMRLCWKAQPASHPTPFEVVGRPLRWGILMSQQRATLCTLTSDDCLEAESLTPPKTFFKQCLVVDGPALRENAMALDSLSEVSQSTAVPCTKISR